MRSVSHHTFSAGYRVGGAWKYGNEENLINDLGWFENGAIDGIFREFLGICTISIKFVHQQSGDITIDSGFISSSCGPWISMLDLGFTNIGWYLTLEAADSLCCCCCLVVLQLVASLEMLEETSQDEGNGCSHSASSMLRYFVVRYANMSSIPSLSSFWGMVEGLRWNMDHFQWWNDEPRMNW